MSTYVQFFDVLAAELETAISTESFTDPRGGVANRLAFAGDYVSRIPVELVTPARRLISNVENILQTARTGVEDVEALIARARASALEWRAAVRAYRGADPGT